MVEMVNVGEYRKELEGEYENGVRRAIDRGKTRFDGNFYVELVNTIKRKYRKHGEIHPFFYDRKSCPTPMFDQVVYKYDSKKDTLDMLWCLPNKEESLNYYHNKDRVPVSEYSLLQQVMDYFDGSIFALVDRMEIEDGTAVH